MIHYKTILAAIQKLDDAGCRRDMSRGMWVSKDGRDLAPDPLSAVRELRSRVIADAMEEQRQSGRHWIR